MRKQIFLETVIVISNGLRKRIDNMFFHSFNLEIYVLEARELTFFFSSRAKDFRIMNLRFRNEYY